MVRKSSQEVAPAAASQALSNIDAQLSAEASQLMDRLSQPSGNKIKIEVVGEFTLPNGVNIGNEFQAVVVDFINRNQFFTTTFDPSVQVPPDCYAFNFNLAQMAPEDDSPNKQHSTCNGCPMNAFKSHKNGKAKACQNRMWLALLIVDPENPEAHNEPGAPLYLLDLSPTNKASFENIAKYIASAMGNPIKAIVTVSAKNKGSYAVVSFSDPEPNPDYAQHFARREEAKQMLTRRPDFAAAEAKAVAASSNRRGAGTMPRRVPGR